MAHYFCDVSTEGAILKDVVGFGAVDDEEALAIVRAIATISLRQMHVARAMLLLLRTETGKVVMSASIDQLASPTVH